jgi:hypothetical protein
LFSRVPERGDEAERLTRILRLGRKQSRLAAQAHNLAVEPGEIGAALFGIRQDVD